MKEDTPSETRMYPREFSNQAHLRNERARCAALSMVLPLKYVNARVAQLVEYDLAKVGVAGSSPVSRSSEFNNMLLWLSR